MFSIEVPVYAHPVSVLNGIMRRRGISISLYGGYPDSSLNGGRMNFCLDGYIPVGRILAPEKEENRKARSNLLAGAQTDYLERIETANRHRIAFNLAFTNYFVEPGELDEARLAPLDRLVESGARHQMRNGVIVANLTLENCLRKRYADALLYISSCTKYVVPERLLTLSEAMRLYRRDMDRYDLVVLTPQHSRNARVLRAMATLGSDKVVAICNSYCAATCNSYWHYEMIARHNKKSLLDYSADDLAAAAAAFQARYPKCTALKQAGRKMNVAQRVKRQLQAGITHFKVGRGFGDNCLEELVDLLPRSSNPKSL